MVTTLGLAQERLVGSALSKVYGEKSAEITALRTMVKRQSVEYREFEYWIKQLGATPEGVRWSLHEARLKPFEARDPFRSAVQKHSQSSVPLSM